MSFKSMFEEAKKKPEWYANGLHIEICECICAEMERQKITKSELARRIGVNRAAVSRWLSDANLCLLSIGKMCLALNLELEVKKK